MIGQSIRNFIVKAEIGAGGMGVVYRATDTTLKRDVALKVLPEDLARDPRRLARLRREAQVLASLNHPNIASIYGLEETGEVTALIMELVEGEDLAVRISKGPMQSDEAVRVALQIAGGLEYAHGKGVIHRDLKPANIKLTPEGNVKLLDFGLARALQVRRSPEELSDSPTWTTPVTQDGVIAGTAAYMSPQQAKTGEADRQTDIWAFGCVLYEMLTGGRAFGGDSTAEVLAAVVHKEPDWSLLPEDLPKKVRRLLTRCMVKDAQLRLRDIGDAWLSLRETDEQEFPPTSAAAVPAGRFSPASAVVGLILGLVLGAVGWQALHIPDREKPVPVQFSMLLPEGKKLQTGDYPESTLRISPDGSRIVYVGGRDWRSTRLVMRPLDRLELTSIPGTEEARQPFFSPDGKWLAFFTRQGELKKVPVDGGNAVVLLEKLPGAAWAFGSWGDNDEIVFSVWATQGLNRISANGGAVRTYATSSTEWPLSPQVLPGSEVVLYSLEGEEGARIAALNLNSGEETTLLENASNPLYLSSGELLFSRNGTLMKKAFDFERLTTSGPEVPLEEQVRVDSPVLASGNHLLDVAANGTLVYAPEPEHLWDGTLVWVNRQGEITEVASETETLPAISFFQLSPDGRRVAVSSKQGDAARLEILDLERKVSTPESEAASIIAVMPVWLSEERVAFSRCSTSSGRIFIHEVASAQDATLLIEAESYFGLTPWTVRPQGDFLGYTSWTPSGEDDTDFYGFDDSLPSPGFLKTPFSEYQPSFSPDGNWIAYTSNESGTMEIYIREFPSGSRKTRISHGGGWAPLWSPTGDEVFFQSENGRRVMSVSIQTGVELQIGRPQLLFEGPYHRSADIGLAYDVSPDGQRFLMMQVNEELETVGELVVVPGWAHDRWPVNR